MWRIGIARTWKTGFCRCCGSEWCLIHLDEVAEDAGAFVVQVGIGRLRCDIKEIAEIR